MPQILRRSLLFLFCALALHAQRVILVSFDALGNRTFTSDPVAEELKVLRASARRGTVANGVQPAFPSTTANSHAALWTGCYGDVNDVTANAPPIVPRAEHRSTERANGFAATSLHAETIWVTAAKAGLSAVAHQPTQGYPFTPFNSAPGAVVVNGYQTRSIAPFALYTSAPFKHGPLTFQAEPVPGGLRISAGGRSVVVLAAPDETDTPRRRDLARHFSPGLAVDGPAPAVLYFRLFELKGDQFRLLVTPWQELGTSVELPGLLAEAGGSMGNGAMSLLGKGQINEAEYLETVELCIRQMTRHAAWLDHRFKPRFFQSYLPFPDEFDHAWIGLPEKARFRRWGYAAVNRGAAAFARLAGPKDHVLWVSDHGMAPVTSTVSIGKALRDAGLDGKVSYLYNSVLVDTSDWLKGSVPLAERAAMLDRARAALSAIPAMRAFFTPEQDGARYGIGGPAGGDLYFDLAPGYQASGRVEPELITKLDGARGVHGFLPSREDMLAICILTGPKARAGARWPRMRIIDVAPLVADLLGIQPPATARGRSPL
jgi:hypothetical protein